LSRQSDPHASADAIFGPRTQQAFEDFLRCADQQAAQLIDGLECAPSLRVDGSFSFVADRALGEDGANDGHAAWFGL
jgi:hypothetical protein